MIWIVIGPAIAQAVISFIWTVYNIGQFHESKNVVKNDDLDRAMLAEFKGHMKREANNARRGALGFLTSPFAIVVIPLLILAGLLWLMRGIFKVLFLGLKRSASALTYWGD